MCSYDFFNLLYERVARAPNIREQIAMLRALVPHGIYRDYVE